MYVRFKKITYIRSSYDSNLPHLYLVLSFGMTQSKFTKTFGVTKLESLSLLCGLVCVILHLADLVEH